MWRVLSWMFCAVVLAGQPVLAQPAPTPPPAPREPVPPDPVARAEQLMQRGLELARSGAHDAALASFKEAAGLVPDANLPHKLAAEQLEELGRYLEAIAEYRRYIAIKPDGKGVADARVRIEKLEQEHVGVLVIACRRAGALVDVDGTAIGTTPLAPIPRLAPSTVSIAISAPGYERHTDTVALTPGTRTTVDCVLEPVHVDKPPPVGGPGPAQVEGPPSTKWYRRWIVVGPALGIAAALVGVGLYVALSDGVPDTDGGSHPFP